MSEASQTFLNWYYEKQERTEANVDFRVMYSRCTQQIKYLPLSISLPFLAVGVLPMIAGLWSSLSAGAEFSSQAFKCC